MNKKIPTHTGVVISRRARGRREYFKQIIGDFSNYKSLEIGALDDPLLLRSETNVRYADYFSTEELIELCRRNQNRKADNLVEVDYVLQETPLEAINEKFDVFVANHVIEHVPNPIRWLRTLRSLSESQGLLFLSIPDREHCFDYHRSRTDAVDWIRSFEEGLESPSKYQIFKHNFYHTNVRPKDTWGGEIPDYRGRAGSITKIQNRSYELALDYRAVHCSVFTPASFRALIEDLNCPEFVPWQIIDMTDTVVGTAEFRAVLRATEMIGGLCFEQEG